MKNFKKNLNQQAWNKLSLDEKKKVIGLLNKVQSNGMSRFYMALAFSHEINTYEILKYLN